MTTTPIWIPILCRHGKELIELEALTDLPQLGPILSCSKLFRNWLVRNNLAQLFKELTWLLKFGVVMSSVSCTARLAKKLWQTCYFNRTNKSLQIKILAQCCIKAIWRLKQGGTKPCTSKIKKIRYPEKILRLLFGTLLCTVFSVLLLICNSLLVQKSRQEISLHVGVEARRDKPDQG